MIKTKPPIISSPMPAAIPVSQMKALPLFQKDCIIGKSLRCSKQL
jgi:hypothetical protein